MPNLFRHPINTMQISREVLKQVQHDNILFVPLLYPIIKSAKNILFNGSLQERNENFGMLYVRWGQDFIDELIRHFDPLAFEFAVVTES